MRARRALIGRWTRATIGGVIALSVCVGGAPIAAAAPGSADLGSSGSSSGSAGGILDRLLGFFGSAAPAEEEPVGTKWTGTWGFAGGLFPATLTTTSEAPLEGTINVPEAPCTANWREVGVEGDQRIVEVTGSTGVCVDTVLRVHKDDLSVNGHDPADPAISVVLRRF